MNAENAMGVSGRRKILDWRWKAASSEREIRKLVKYIV